MTDTTTAEEPTVTEPSDYETATHLQPSCQTGHHFRCCGHRTWSRKRPATKDAPAQMVQVHSLCECGCHADRLLTCLTCGGEFELNAVGVCINPVSCAEHLESVLGNNPNWLKYREIRQWAKQERAADVTQVERRERQEARPKVGSCHHCGAPTKGGKFVVGHDAKLKGELVREAQGLLDEPWAVPVDAVLELLVRGWPTHSIKNGPGQKALKTGTSRLDATPSGEFLDRRNAARSDRTSLDTQSNPVV